MLLGHIGIGFASKALQKKLPFWTLFIAVLLPDLMSAVFGLIGIGDESAFWSHSLLMTCVFALLAGVIIFIIYRKPKPALFFSALVLSHWVCDLISWPLEAIGIYNRIHIFSRKYTYGLGLYKTLAGALVCEFVLLGTGIALYIRSRQKQRKGLT
jgi:hypothetical protein